MLRYLLDTNICIAAMRNNAAVVGRMSSISPVECAVSSITTYELFTGIEKCAAPERERGKVELLLKAITEIPFDSQAAIEAARIRVIWRNKARLSGHMIFCWRDKPGRIS